jgi:hypothetical protein
MQLHHVLVNLPTGGHHQEKAAYLQQQTGKSFHEIIFDKDT